jgi:hypothetical protein
MKYTAGKCGVITKIAVFENFSVFKRDWREPGMPLYVVFDDNTDYGVAEFKTKAAAIRWASKAE